jgi:hypothetical protein
MLRISLTAGTLCAIGAKLVEIKENLEIMVKKSLILLKK